LSENFKMKKKIKEPAMFNLTGNEMLEHLEDLRDAEIGDNHPAYAKTIELAGKTLRVLNIDSYDLYHLVFDGNVYAECLAEVAENNPKVREELETIKNLELLYQELRLLKVEGKAYEVLDNFFNLNLGKTL